MSEAKITYAVGLVSDRGCSIRSPTFTQSLSLLNDFLNAHQGEYGGCFIQNKEEFPEYALAIMTSAVRNILESTNVTLLKTEGSTPFIVRLEGLMFDITKAHGMTIYPEHIPYYPECTI